VLVLFCDVGAGCRIDCSLDQSVTWHIIGYKQTELAGWLQWWCSELTWRGSGFESLSRRWMVQTRFSWPTRVPSYKCWVAEILDLLRCSTAPIGRNGRFCLTCRSHLQEWSRSRIILHGLLDPWRWLTRKDDKYWSTLLNIPEMPRSRVHRGGSVRSRVLRYFLKSDEHFFFSHSLTQHDQRY